MATIVTNTGKGVITSRFLANQAPIELFVGWGTGTGTASATDISLFTESVEERAQATISQVTTTSTDDTVQCVGTLQATGSRSITNAGMFDAATSGNLIVKGDFVPVALNIDDSICFTIKIQFA
jgi:hypothetical protein